MKLVLPNNIFKTLLGILILGEVFLCGSGQVLLLPGGITLKMLNYGIMLIIGGALLLYRPIVSKDIVKLILFYVTCLLIGIFNSILNGGIENIFYDLSPLLYFFTILFFWYYIKELKDIFFIRNVLKFCVLFMALGYLFYMILMKLNVLDFANVYVVLSRQSDIMFRGVMGHFFYKGFIYLIIGLIFYISEGKLLSWQSFCILLAIYFTQTRGFLIISVCAVLFYIWYWLYVRKFRIPLYNLLLSLFLFFVVFAYITYSYENFVGVDRSSGDEIRMITLNEVMEDVSLTSLFVGHGFGVGVPIRPIHMEMAYLEVFHKQGILGLLFWLYWLVSSLLLFIGSSVKKREFGLPFLISIIIIYLQSVFNPFLNNPIGMSIVIISYISLLRIKQMDDSVVKNYCNSELWV